MILIFVFEENPIALPQFCVRFIYHEQRQRRRYSSPGCAVQYNCYLLISLGMTLYMWCEAEYIRQSNIFMILKYVHHWGVQYDCYLLISLGMTLTCGTEQSTYTTSFTKVTLPYFTVFEE